MSMNGGITKLGQSLISTMPPAFLLLLLINLLFLGLIVWFLKDQLEARDKMAQQLFERCMAIALHDQP